MSPAVDPFSTEVMLSSALLDGPDDPDDVSRLETTCPPAASLVCWTLAPPGVSRNGLCAKVDDVAEAEVHQLCVLQNLWASAATVIWPCWHLGASVPGHSIVSSLSLGEGLGVGDTRATGRGRGRMPLEAHGRPPRAVSVEVLVALP